MALYDQVAADEIKEERCQLRDEIIKEFYKELTVEDLVADVVDLPEDVGKTRTIVACAMVGANFLHAGDRLPAPLRQPAHHPYPLLGEPVHLALHARHEPALEWIERDRCEAQDRTRTEAEEQDSP